MTRFRVTGRCALAEWRFRRRVLRGLGVTGAAVALAAAAFVALATAAVAKPFANGGTDMAPAVPQPAGTAADGTLPPGQGINRQTVTVPMWNSSFAFGGETWGSTMVGTDPANGSATTRVPVVVVPLRMVFADGTVLEDPGAASDAVASPLFQPTAFQTGTTQYPDAFRRADFWNDVSTEAPDYHTLLGDPVVAAPQTWNVPGSKGVVVFNPSADRPFGYVDSSWLGNRVRSAVNALHIDPQALVILLSYNTVGVNGNPSSCFAPSGCQLDLGYHGAQVNGDPVPGSQPAQSLNTFVYAAYEDLGDEIPPQFNESLYALSHELLEWMDDPIAIGRPADNPFAATAFGSFVPAWQAPDGSCSNLYEVADPVQNLTSIGVPDRGRIDLFADAVFQSWFADNVPSNALDGRYDISGLLSGPSPGC